MRKSLDFTSDEKRLFLECTLLTLSNFPQAVLAKAHFVKKYTQLLARVYEQIGIDMQTKVPDYIIEFIILPH